MTGKAMATCTYTMTALYVEYTYGGEFSVHESIIYVHVYMYHVCIQAM